jgi:hypothetical protein
MAVPEGTVDKLVLEESDVGSYLVHSVVLHLIGSAGSLQDVQSTILKHFVKRFKSGDFTAVTDAKKGSLTLGFPRLADVEAFVSQCSFTLDSADGTVKFFATLPSNSPLLKTIGNPTVLELFCPRFLPEGLIRIASKLPAVISVIDTVTRHHAADIRVKLSSVLALVRVSDNELYSRQIEVPFQLGQHEGVIKVSRVRFERFARAGTVPTLTVSSLEKLAVRSSGMKRTADDMEAGEVEEGEAAESRPAGAAPPERGAQKAARDIKKAKLGSSAGRGAHQQTLTPSLTGDAKAAASGPDRIRTRSQNPV